MRLVGGEGEPAVLAPLPNELQSLREVSSCNSSTSSGQGTHDDHLVLFSGRLAVSAAASGAGVVVRTGPTVYVVRARSWRQVVSAMAAAVIALAPDEEQKRVLRGRLLAAAKAATETSRLNCDSLLKVLESLLLNPSGLKRAATHATAKDALGTRYPTSVAVPRRGGKEPGAVQMLVLSAQTMVVAGAPVPCGLAGPLRGRALCPRGLHALALGAGCGCAVLPPFVGADKL